MKRKSSMGEIRDSVNRMMDETVLSNSGEGEYVSYQCPEASFIAQLAKNLPAIQETWVQSLGC